MRVIDFAIRRCYLQVLNQFLNKSWWVIGLLLVVIGLLGAVFYGDLASKFANNKVEKTINDVEQNFDRLAYEWLYNLDEKDKDYIWSRCDFHKKERKFPACVFLYDDTTCVYWNHSVVVPDSVLLSYKEGLSVVRIDDTEQTFLVKSHKFKEKTAVMLFIVDSDNEWYNKWEKDCIIIDHNKYTVDLCDLGDGAVKDNCGKPLFFVRYCSEYDSLYLFDFIFVFGVLILLCGAFINYVKHINSQNIIRDSYIFIAVCAVVRYVIFLLNIFPASGELFSVENHINIRVGGFSVNEVTVGDVFIDIIFVLTVIYTILYLKSYILKSINRFNNKQKTIAYVTYIIVNSIAICFLLYLCVLVVKTSEIDVNYLSYYDVGMTDVMLLSIIAIASASIYVIDIFERGIFSKNYYLLLKIIKLAVVTGMLLISYKLYGDGLIYVLNIIAVGSLIDILSVNLRNKKSIYACVNVFVAIVVTIFLTVNSNEQKKEKIEDITDVVIENSLNKSTLYSFIMLPDEYKEIIISDISYVKIKNGVIVESLGKMVSDDVLTVVENGKFTKIKGYVHYKKTKGDVQVVLSYHINNIANYLLLFIVVFLFIQIVVLLLMGAWFFFPELNFICKSIYAKLRVIVFLVCLISVFAVLIFINKYMDSSQEDKDMIYLTSKVKDLSAILIDNFKDKDFSAESLDSCLKPITKQWNFDVNVYDEFGKIVFTSDSMALENELVSFYVNPWSYERICYKNIMLVTNKTKIYNDFCYLTFFPLRISDSQCIYVQLLDTGTTDLSLKEALKIDIINLFIVIFGIIFVILIVFYNYTMKPLILLKDHVSRFKYRKRIDSMMYKKGTEIDELIDLYNNAIDELENTLVKLAEIGRVEALTVLTRQIAHELRNPLTPIKLKAQMLLRRKQNGDKNWDENIEESLNIIVTQINLIENTIKQLSSLTAVSSTTVDRVNIDKMMNEIKYFYDGYPNIDINYVNKTHNEDIYIVMSYDNLWSVLTNIMVNAIAAIGKRVDGKIIMELNITEAMIIMSIEDNGGGVDEDVKDRIFAPNFTTKKSGSGIGLTIALGIVRNAGGQIYYENEKNVGAKFFVEIPILRN